MKILEPIAHGAAEGTGPRHSKTRVVGGALFAALLVSASACGNGNGHANAAPNEPPVEVPAAVLTPILMQVAEVPVPVRGSDERYHVVYELELTNFTREPVALERLEVLDAQSGAPVATLDAPTLAERLAVNDVDAPPGSLGAAQFGLVSVHLAFDGEVAIPAAIDHRLSAAVGTQSMVETAARIGLADPTTLLLDPPLRGPRYIAGDGCCDSHRHVRATLPINGRLYTAQRFAIDWEQLDEQGRIYTGDPKDPASYTIYGKPVYAVADGQVIAAVDVMPDSPIGGFPEDITLEQADGNHVVLDLGDGRFALYAHLKPRSVLVTTGQQVRRGQVLGEVGTSGNSSEPHLHFHLTDGPSPMASNGLPYPLRQFSSTQRGVSTAAFDRAIIDGQPIATEPVAGPALRRNALPLDLWIVDFADQTL